MTVETKYVDPAGDNAGTGNSELDPWATFTYATAIARGLTNPLVYGADGNYSENAVIESAGGSNKTVGIIQALPGARPNIVGNASGEYAWKWNGGNWKLEGFDILHHDPQPIYGNNFQHMYINAPNIWIKDSGIKSTQALFGTVDRSPTVRESAIGFSGNAKNIVLDGIEIRWMKWAGLLNVPEDCRLRLTGGSIIADMNSNAVFIQGGASAKVIIDDGCILGRSQTSDAIQLNGTNAADNWNEHLFTAQCFLPGNFGENAADHKDAQYCIGYGLMINNWPVSNDGTDPIKGFNRSPEGASWTAGHSTVANPAPISRISLLNSVVYNSAATNWFAYSMMANNSLIYNQYDIIDGSGSAYRQANTPLMIFNAQNPGNATTPQRILNTVFSQQPIALRLRYFTWLTRLDGNCYHACNTIDQKNITGTTGPWNISDPADFARWKSESALDANSVYTDTSPFESADAPVNADPSVYDFRIKAGSAAEGIGVHLDQLAAPAGLSGAATITFQNDISWIPNGGDEGTTPAGWYHSWWAPGEPFDTGKVPFRLPIYIEGAGQFFCGPVDYATKTVTLYDNTGAPTTATTATANPKIWLCKADGTANLNAGADDFYGIASGGTSQPQPFQSTARFAAGFDKATAGDESIDLYTPDNDTTGDGFVNKGATETFNVIGSAASYMQATGSGAVGLLNIGHYQQKVVAKFIVSATEHIAIGLRSDNAADGSQTEYRLLLRPANGNIRLTRIIAGTATTINNYPITPVDLIYTDGVTENVFIGEITDDANGNPVLKATLNGTVLFENVIDTDASQITATANTYARAEQFTFTNGALWTSLEGYKLSQASAAVTYTTPSIGAVGAKATGNGTGTRTINYPAGVVNGESGILIFTETQFNGDHIALPTGCTDLGYISGHTPTTRVFFKIAGAETSIDVSQTNGGNFQGYAARVDNLNPSDPIHDFDSIEGTSNSTSWSAPAVTDTVKDQCLAVRALMSNLTTDGVTTFNEAGYTEHIDTANSATIAFASKAIATAGPVGASSISLSTGGVAHAFTVVFNPKESAGGEAPPIANDDTAYHQTNQSVTSIIIPVLDNDSYSGAGNLVVGQITTNPSLANCTAEITDSLGGNAGALQYIKYTNPDGITGMDTIGYKSTADGGVTYSNEAIITIINAIQRPKKLVSTVANAFFASNIGTA